MKKDDFLVTTTVEGKSWHAVWDHEDPLELDFPVFWELYTDDRGVFLRHKADGKSYAIDPVYLKGQGKITLPAVPGEPRQVTLQFKKLQRIRPPFLPDPEAIRMIGPAEHYVSAGIREHLISFEGLEKGGYTAQIENATIFRMVPTSTGLQVEVKRPGVRFKLLGQPSRPMAVGSPVSLSVKDVYHGAFIFGSYWWRINKVRTPEMLSMDELEQEEQAQDMVSLRALGKAIGGFVLAIALIMQGVHYLNLMKEEKKPKPPLVAKVELKKPKIIPKAPEPPKPVPPPLKPPEPPKIVKKEPPKPKPKPREIVKREPPKRRPKPRRRIVKHVPRRPVHRPIERRRPAPPIVAKAPVRHPAPPRAQRPPAVSPKAVARAPVSRVPNPSVVQAQQKAALAQSLNFLSSGPPKNVHALATVPGRKFSARYATAGREGIPASTSALNKLANQNTGDGPITTRGSRSLAATSGIKGHHGKGLNRVLGKVSLSALYGRGSGAALGAAAGGGGISVRGPGKISDADIEKTLKRYLQKFQYCYEKALLSNSNLSGTVQMQWTINVGGSVSGAEVVRSAMHNQALHHCLVYQLSQIRFPSPKGGAVVVRKPFSFQSSTL